MPTSLATHQPLFLSWQKWLMVFRNVLFIAAAAPVHVQWNFGRLHDWLLDACLHYGKTFRIMPFFTMSIYFTADPKNVQHMLQDNVNAYTKEGLLLEVVSDLLGDGIFQVSHGPHSSDGGKSWTLQRKIAAQVFTRSNFRGYMERTFVARGLELVSLLDSAAVSGATVDLQDYFFKLALDSIGLLGFGIDLGCMRASTSQPFAVAFDAMLNDSFQRFVTVSSMIFFLVFPAFIRRRLSWLMRRFPIEHRMQDNLRLINSFALDVIRQRRKLRRRSLSGEGMVKDDSDMFDVPDGLEAEKWNDFLTLFMAAGEAMEQPFSDVFLRDVVMSFFIAGRDTTASTLSWLFLMLAKHPEVAEKLAKEVDDCCPRGTQPSFDRVKDSAMPYLNAIVWETLRLFPPVAADPKVAATDDVLPDGTFVPKGAEIVYLPYVMGRLEELWGPDADIFKPDRWIPFSQPSLFKFPVFQAGPRICLGMNMALLEVKITVVLLVQHFDMRLACDKRVAYKLGPTICIRDGLYARVTHRK